MGGFGGGRFVFRAGPYPFHPQPASLRSAGGGGYLFLARFGV